MKKLLLLLLVTSAHAQPYKGLDLLALAKMNSQMVGSTITPGTSIGALAGTFGHIGPGLSSLLQSGKVPAFRVHLMNGPCWRGHNCERDEPRLSDLRTLAKRASDIETLAARFPNSKCFLSPVLEYDERSPVLVTVWIQTLREKAPSCTPVLNPASGVTIPGVLIERHGLGSSADVISNDGEPLSTLPQYKASVLKLAWDYPYNLRTKDESVFTPPKLRTYQVTKQDIQKGLRAL